MFSCSFGKKTTYENASKEVGQRFADEYVKPLVDKLDKEKKDKKAKQEKQAKNTLDNENKIEEVD